MEVIYKPEINVLICKSNNCEINYVIFQVYGQKFIKLTNNQFVPPPHSEVFVGNIPRTMPVDEIFKFFSRCGKIYQMRVLMDFSGCNRGKCFIQYTTLKASREAICCLHQEPIGSLQNLAVVRMSLNNDQLILKLIPNWISPLALKQKVITFMGEGLKQVIVKTSKYYPYQNICYCHYENHQSAVSAHKKAWPFLNFFGTLLEVHWAVPELIRKARNLFFTNFPPDMTKKEFFEIVRTKIELMTLIQITIKNQFGFITFSGDPSLLKGEAGLSGLTIRGFVLEFSFVPFQNNSVSLGFKNGTTPQVLMPIPSCPFHPQVRIFNFPLEPGFPHIPMPIPLHLPPPGFHHSVSITEKNSAPIDR